MSGDSPYSASLAGDRTAASGRSLDLERGTHGRKPLKGGTDVGEKEQLDLAGPSEPQPDTDKPTLHTGPHQATGQDALPVYRPTHPDLSVYSLVVFGTIWGVLTRLSLQWIGGFASSAVFSLVWAQMVGCFVMGFVTSKKNAIERVFPPLFVMCGTAFCGSLTTWSSMMGDVFTAFANLNKLAGTSRFVGFLSGVAITLVTLATSNMAFQGGLHLAGIVPSPSCHPHRRPRQRAFNLSTMLAGPLCWLGAILLLAFGPVSWRSRATFAIVLGPPGTILRYLAAKHLNRLNPRLPIGTLLANSSAVLVFAVAALLARHPRSALGCAALKGVQDGFCGSLSTISTLVAELRAIETRHSYRYFLVSWVVAQLVLVAVLGSWVWSGDRGPLCWER